MKHYVVVASDGMPALAKQVQELIVTCEAEPIGGVHTNNDGVVAQACLLNKLPEQYVQHNESEALRVITQAIASMKVYGDLQSHCAQERRRLGYSTQGERETKTAQQYLTDELKTYFALPGDFIAGAISRCSLLDASAVYADLLQATNGALMSESTTYVKVMLGYVYISSKPTHQRN